MVLKFKSEDFIHLFPFDTQIMLRIECAQNANKLFNEWLQTLPEVELQSLAEGEFWAERGTVDFSEYLDEQAKLIKS